MRPFAERRYFPREVRAAFHLATYIVNGLGQRSPEIRCHELALAVAPILREEIRGINSIVWSGHYGAVEHSWLKVSTLDPFTATGRHIAEWHILDVYAVGRMPQVQLVDGTAILPEWKLYKPAKMREDTDHKLVTELVREMREFIQINRSTAHGRADVAKWREAIDQLETMRP